MIVTKWIGVYYASEVYIAQVELTQTPKQWRIKTASYIEGLMLGKETAVDACQLFAHTIFDINDPRFYETRTEAVNALVARLQAKLGETLRTAERLKGVLARL